MADNPAHTLVKKDRTRVIAEEQDVGGHFEGESERERRVGVDEEVVVDIFKRNVQSEGGLYFLRVSLRSMVNPKLILRYEADLDKYGSEAELLKAVAIGGGALAEQDCTKRGATWDCEYVAKQAQTAARELLHAIDIQD